MTQRTRLALAVVSAAALIGLAYNLGRASAAPLPCRPIAARQLGDTVAIRRFEASTYWVQQLDGCAGCLVLMPLRDGAPTITPSSAVP